MRKFRRAVRDGRRIQRTAGAGTLAALKGAALAQAAGRVVAKRAARIGSDSGPDAGGPSRIRAYGAREDGGVRRLGDDLYAMFRRIGAAGGSICVVRDGNRDHRDRRFGSASNIRSGRRHTEPICRRVVCPGTLSIDCRRCSGHALVWSRHDSPASSGHPKFQTIGLITRKRRPRPTLRGIPPVCSVSSAVARRQDLRARDGHRACRRHPAIASFGRP